MPESLSIAQQSRLRKMIGDRAHPDAIDDYLRKCGIAESEFADAYDQLHMRRSHVMDCYKMKRNVRIVGILVMIASIAASIVGGDQIVVVVSLGLLLYGLALAITGNMKVFG